LVGCALGGASSRFVVPPASAQQAATLRPWEYFCSYNEPVSGFGDLSAQTRGNATARANALGAQAWELIPIDNSNWCFKRPKM
jgi:hypothetical protein